MYVTDQIFALGSAVLNIRNQKSYKRNNTHKYKNALNISKATKPPDIMHRRATNGPPAIHHSMAYRWRAVGGPLLCVSCAIVVEIITGPEMIQSVLNHKTRPINNEISVLERTAAAVTGGLKYI